jgi:hypothetical protein
LSNHTSIEDADDSEGEQSTSDSQRSTNLEVWPRADHEYDLNNQVTRASQYQSKITRYQSRKRKQNFEGKRDGKRTNIEPADATEVELGSRSLEYSSLLEIRPGTDHNERHDQRPRRRPSQQTPGTTDDYQITASVSRATGPASSVRSRGEAL